MGRVWRAVDEMLDRLVAVKEMRIDGLDAEDTRTRRERTLREARASARIDHPNVVRVYDVVDEGERLWIVMELVAGRSLERIMAEEGPLGPCRAARIGMGLVAALRQVHDRGVLHRDIKPGNVLVETEQARGRGRVVLTDFGIAAIQDAKALTMVGMLVGSPDYMAPERVSGRPQGPPSDIWSLGATLSAALAGRSPFSRDTTLATLHAVLYEEPELPSTAGPLRETLAALLHKDPSLRPGLDDLEAALQPVAYPAPTPTVRVVGEEETSGRGGGLGERPGRETGAGPEERLEPEAGLGSGAGPEGRLGPEAGLGSGAGPEGRLEPEAGLGSGAGPEERSGPETGSVPDTEPEPGTEPGTESAPDPGPATGAAPESEAEPEPEPPGASPYEPESPTPAFLDASRVPAPPDPRQPEDIRDAIPPSSTTPIASSASAPTAFPAPTASSASTPAESSASAPTPTTSPAPALEPTTAAPTRTPTPIPTPTPTPTTEPPPRPPNASTEHTTPESRSEAHSATPAGNSTGPTPHRPGVSLSRSEAVTERRPPPGPPPGTGSTPDGSRQLYGTMPPGELPGPPVPAHPRRPRRGHRRTGIVAAIGIAAAGAVVAVLLAGNFGSPKDDEAGSGSPSSTASSPGATPSSTVEGTSRPQSLPPGARREAGGFAWVPPEGWRRDVKTGSEVHYTSPDAKQELAAKSSLARDDLMDSWQKSEQNAQQGKDYSKIRLERTTFRGHPAVVWEYTFTLRGDPWHARLLGFTVGGKSYQVNTWYRPEVEAQAVKTYERVRDGFTVL
ncbi:protein kinase domain-containing protein [Streptomyces sp. UG1]|uniref:serine/threonine-protein kinase n=1 Tax=Streptomyces sp. UG1 TaxID=3417652 RepID=UPI003CF7D19D